MSKLVCSLCKFLAFLGVENTQFDLLVGIDECVTLKGETGDQFEPQGRMSQLFGKGKRTVRCLYCVFNIPMCEPSIIN